jgi:hypothetical protein
MIREMIELPLRHPTLFKTLGVKPPKVCHFPCPVPYFSSFYHSLALFSCSIISS